MKMLLQRVFGLAKQVTTGGGALPVFAVVQHGDKGGFVAAPVNHLHIPEGIFMHLFWSITQGLPCCSTP